MNEKNEMLERDFQEELKKIPLIDDLLPLVDTHASSLGLMVFIFTPEDIKEYFQAAAPDLGMVTISSEPDNAIWNIRNFKHSYLARFPEGWELVQPYIQDVVEETT